MKLLGRRKDVGTADAGDAALTGESATPEADPTGTSRTTAPKGRPTPKRNEVTRKRGPVVPAPMTTAEARARRKAMAGPKLTRAERRADKAQRRERMNARRQRMLAGDEDSLPDRDRGPVRRYIRDVVDARRNLLGLFLPAGMALMFFSMAIPQLQFYLYPALFILMAAMAVDAIVLARKVNRRVDAKFPGDLESRWKLGLYAVGRASQLRRMRIPRPQVKRGERVD